MNILSSLTTPSQPVYSHEAMTRKDARAYTASLFEETNRRGLLMTAPYDCVEYLNSPSGLIVLAHHNAVAGQIDGIHPAELSRRIDRPANIVEPLKRRDSTSPSYCAHYMTRRSQGGLVLEAFGRMIDGGDPLAPMLTTERRFSFEIFDAPFGPVVTVTEIGCDTVYMIRPASVAVREAA